MAIGKQKSARNKTIDLSLEEGRAYLDAVLDGKGALSEFPVDRVILGDTLTVLPRLKKGSVDLLIVDPPYNLKKNFGAVKFKVTDSESYRAYTRAWLEAVSPLLSPTASVYVCCDWQSGLIIGEVLGEYLHVRNRITWQREKGRGAAKNWKNGMEDIWFATVSEEYTFDLNAVKLRRRVLAPYTKDGQPRDWQEDPESGDKFRDTCPSNFWDDISIPYWSMAENTAHPTQKPEKLIAKLILASSKEGDLVLDPFLGSGTTAVVAKKLGRHFIGIEQDPTYCIWAQKRLEDAERDPSIQGYVNGVFWERNTQVEQKKAKNRKGN